jgi:hypothetical protein
LTPVPDAEPNDETFGIGNDLTRCAADERLLDASLLVLVLPPPRCVPFPLIPLLLLLPRSAPSPLLLLLLDFAGVGGLSDASALREGAPRSRDDLMLEPDETAADPTDAAAVSMVLLTFTRVGTLSRLLV